MNTKAQTTIFIAVVVAFMVFIAGMIMVNFLKQPIDAARISLSCAAPTSDGNKISCLAVDLVMSYWFIIVLSLAVGYITGRFLI